MQLHILSIFLSENGGVAEWTKAPVLKTGDGQLSVGSNPTPSANLEFLFDHGVVLSEQCALFGKKKRYRGIVMKDGRKFNKNPITRPKKNGTERARRVATQRKRLVESGMDAEVVRKLNTKEIRELLMKTAKDAAKAKRQAA